MTDKGDILIVDDTHASLKLLTDILTKEGYQVRPADIDLDFTSCQNRVS
jgi:DNA-binding response OmpR family regulator